MPWLWYVAPVAVVIIYILTASRSPRFSEEIERWRKRMARVGRSEGEADAPQGHRGAKGAKGKGPRRVNAPPSQLTRLLEATGGGDVVDYYELCPKLAYLAVMSANAFQGSDHVTVLARLDEAAPTFTVRPLPIVEGKRIANNGVQFKTDAEFTELFLVERGIESGPTTTPTEEGDKAIRKWLSPPLREALLDLPNGWLRIDGKAKVMAFTVYGLVDADRIGELIAAADIVFAEYGADGGPSLVGDDDDEIPAAPPPKKKASSAKQPSA